MASHDQSIPAPTNPAHLSKGYGPAGQPGLSHPPFGNIGAMDFAAAQGAPKDDSPLAQSEHQAQPVHSSVEAGGSRRNSWVTDAGADGDLQRTNSTMSQSQTLTPSRGGTLKKKASLSKKASLKRSGSRRGSGLGSMRGLAMGEKEKYASGQGDEMNSAFFIPVPTTGNATEILANRFQAWRKVLKDLIAYFREVQKGYESRSKSLLTVSNIVNNTIIPPAFLTAGGIGDATLILRNYHKQSLAEGNKARDIENDVIVQLTGLRSDLSQKIKEIKSLSGDFKNAVDKETEATRKAARDLQEALGLVDIEPNATTGKGDPFIVKLRVERQVERQIDEENYLHRAFLNLESSGRELESIVVGEIQKAFNAYAGIIKREADEAYDTAERLRTGPIAMAKDHEWDAFVYENEHFVDPRIPIRKAENIYYPGKDHPAAAEVRAGMLERKSKYLKSYTPGWYVLSPTHLHEFKSADHISAQQPIMSLYLPEQKLGSHSSITSSSHKFMLKGRQTGAMHRGHAWVFRAESHDTMLAWYEDIKSLTEKTGEERNAFVRRHARSVSGGSHKTGSISSDGAMDEDEADEVPYSANATEVQQPVPKQDTLERPQPGGRFPSDLDVNRFLQAPLSPSSAASSGDPDTVIAVGTHPDNGAPLGQRGEGHDSTQGGLDAQHLVNTPHDQQQHDLARQSPEYNYQPVQSQGNSFRIIPYESEPAQKQHRNIAVQSPPKEVPRHDSNYGNWMTSGTVGTKDIAARVVDSETRGQRLNGVEENHGSEYANEAHNTTVVSSTNTTAPAATGLPAKTESSRSALDKPGIGITQTVTSHYMPSNVNDTPLDKSINDNSSAWTKSQGGDAIESPVFVAPHQGQTPDAAGTLTSVTSARPALPSHTSVQTISDLHVPGEYPPTPLA